MERFVDGSSPVPPRQVGKVNPVMPVVKEFLAAVPLEDQDVYRRYMAVVEPPLLKQLMDEYRGNVSRIAARLGVDRRTLRAKLIRYRMY